MIRPRDQNAHEKLATQVLLLAVFPGNGTEFN